MAFLAGFSVATELAEVRRRIGYCPQYDALIDFMTGREILSMFAALRGLSTNETPGVVDALIRRLTLEKHADKVSKSYSGGNKRKLSTAIALIGEPPIVFLDEPTTGMDPGARRFLWDVLVEVVESGRTIVLTSHSMEECEALCTRLGIMVNGQFQCLGSSQHLKSRFGAGISLSAKLRRGALESELQALKRYVESGFPGSELTEEHDGMVRYTITGQPWSKIFGLMEGKKEQLGIEDYSVCQASLESVFLDFAKHQFAGEDTQLLR